MFAAYFVSGIGGNLFSAYFNPHSESIGASTSINGVLTSMLAMVLINWSGFSGNAQL